MKGGPAIVALNAGDLNLGVFDSFATLIPVSTVKFGERLEVREADITDWTFMRNGKIARVSDDDGG